MAEELFPRDLAVAEVAALADDWEGFLRQYSGFMLGCIRRFTSDADERMEMYAHVCSRLRADNCRRLRRFRGESDGRRCRFTTWLATVTLNLCREWIRGHRGRRRLYRAIERLPVLHARVFKYRYWHGFTSEQILGVLGTRADLKSVQDVDRVVAEVEKSLSADHRWRSLARQARADSLDDQVGGAAGIVSVPTHDAPDSAVHRAALMASLRAAIGRLSSTTRSVLELRYRRGLTARAAARELGIEPYKRVYEIQARGLAELRDSLTRDGFSAADLEEKMFGGS